MILENTISLEINNLKARLIAEIDQIASSWGRDDGMREESVFFTIIETNVISYSVLYVSEKFHRDRISAKRLQKKKRLFGGYYYEDTGRNFDIYYSWLDVETLHQAWKVLLPFKKI